MNYDQSCLVLARIGGGSGVGVWCMREVGVCVVLGKVGDGSNGGRKCVWWVGCVGLPVTVGWV